MRFELKMALRFLRAGRGQSIFILMGIAIGVSVQIFLGTLITSLQEDLIDATVGNAAHITLTDELLAPRYIDPLNENTEAYVIEGSFDEVEERVLDWQPIVEYLDQQEQLTAVSPVMNTNASVIKGSLRSPLIIRGVIGERADRIYDFTDNLTQGSYLLQSNRVLIGEALAEKYSLVLGDSFTVELAGGRRDSFIVGGIFNLGQQSIDESWMFLELGRAQKLIGSNGEISAIEIQVKDVFAADEIAADLDLKMINVSLSNWKTENASLLGALQSQSSSSYTIQFFVLLAITLGIASVLSVSVVQKRRQIGILKAMGASGKSTMNIFILQGSILGFLGAALGVLFGFLLIQGFLYGTSIATGEPLFPLNMRLGQTMIILVVTTLASLMSAIVPARNSSNLNPVEVMKG